MAATPTRTPRELQGHQVALPQGLCTCPPGSYSLPSPSYSKRSTVMNKRPPLPLFSAPGWSRARARCLPREERLSPSAVPSPPVPLGAVLPFSASHEHLPL